MTYNVDFRLLGPPVDVAGSVQRGFELGRSRALQDEERRYMLEERRRATQGREARSAYMLADRDEGAPAAFNPVPLPQPNALAPVAPGGLPEPAFGALSGMFGDPQGSSAWVPPTMGAQPHPGGLHQANALSPPTMGATPSAPPARSPQPQRGEQPSARDDALVRFIKADPEAAATMRREDVQDNYRRLQTLETLTNLGLQQLAGVSDQASYDRARAQVRAMYVRVGEDPASIDQLPAQWTPEVSAQLRMQGMSAQQQLAGMIQRSRLQWDIRDDEIDNEREADDSASIRDYRGAQIDLGRARLDVDRDRNDLTRTDPRRIAPGTGRAPSPGSVIGAIMEKQAAGQPLSRAEQRTLDEHRAAARGRRGRGGRGAARGGNEPTARGPDGRRYVVRNGQWVPAQ